MSGQGSADGAAEILARRARALAQRPPEGDGAEDPIEVLQFRLAEETYAVETRFVTAVHPLRTLTPLPGTPPHILGVVNVRGRILPVVDLKKLFELPERGLTDLHRIVQVSGHGLHLGLLADLGLEVRRIARAALQPSLPTLGGMRADYLMGVAGDGLIVLDLERVLADPRIVVDDEVAA